MGPFLGVSIYLHGDKMRGFSEGAMEPLVQAAVIQSGEVQPERLTWTEDPAVKQLLDVVVSILAEEYVRTIKQHPDAFSRNGDPT